MFFDTHTHLDYLAERAHLSLAEIMQQAQANQVEKILLAGADASQFKLFPSFTAPFQDSLKFGLGLHPLFIQQHQEQDLEHLQQILQQRPANCTAIAEIGLDRGMPALLEGNLWQKQNDFLAAQLQFAKQFQLPVSLHSRKTHDQLFVHLKKADLPKRGVVHGFSGSYQQAKRFVDLGYYIGVGGVITYERANKTRQTIAKLPWDCLLLETDSPDMPLFGMQGQPNQPQNVGKVFEVLCELKGVDHNPKEIEKAQDIIWQNSCGLFG